MADKKVKIRLQDVWRENGNVHQPGKEIEISQEFAEDLAAHGLKFQIIADKNDK
ncbi:MAG: hypothetical protein KDD00_17670 [Ignavibacteriae bacterium]|nr:hypothetical protein [Ignavibacteriota bacterium]